METLNNGKINLDKARDFGGNFDTAVDFIKQNFVAICKNVAVFIIPIAMIAAFFADPIPKVPTSTDPIEAMMESLNTGTNIASLIALVGSLLVSLYTVSYMVVYRRSADGQIDPSDVWYRVKKSVLPVIITGVLYGILVVIGTILCLIPGIALLVYLLFFVFEIIEDEVGIIDSLKNSYALVKDYWWSTFGFYIVIAIIVSMIAGIFAVPFYIPMLATALGSDGIFTNSIFIYCAALLMLLAQLFVAPMTYMALGTYYYSLRAENGNDGDEDMISQIGRSDNTIY